MVPYNGKRRQPFNPLKSSWPSAKAGIGEHTLRARGKRLKIDLATTAGKVNTRDPLPPFPQFQCMQIQVGEACFDEMGLKWQL